jgi:predicted TIM-barrel fold metal-dependent hydrolase
VADKLLFGSDYPFFSASEAIESMYRLNEVAQGTRMPVVPREVLRGIIERNALECLGIERDGDATAETESKD